MTNESGTPARRRKRVRIDEEVTILGTNTPKEDTPSNAARNLVKQAVASHPEPIQTFLLSISKGYNALKSKQRHHTSSSAKLQEENFIPRSARVQFTLTAPERVTETNEFKQHKTDVEKALLAYQKACKKAISGTSDLVNEDIKQEVRGQVTTTVLNLCLLILLTKNPEDKNPKHHRLAYYMTNHHLDQRIFDYTWTTKAQVLQSIKQDDMLEDNMAIDDVTEPATQDATTTIWTFDTSTVTFFETLVAPISSLLLATFVSSWDAQLSIYNKKAIDTALSVATKKIMGTSATDKAAQVVDAEPNIGPKKIKEMIENAVKQKTKSLQTEVTKLSEKIHRSKNEQRGTSPRPSHGAPSSTKNSDGKKNAKPGAKNGNGKGNKTGQNKKKGKSDAIQENNDGDSQRGRSTQKPKSGKPPQRKKRSNSKQRSNKN